MDRPDRRHRARAHRARGRGAGEGGAAQRPRGRRRLAAPPRRARDPRRRRRRAPSACWRPDSGGGGACRMNPATAPPLVAAQPLRRRRRARPRHALRADRPHARRRARRPAGAAAGARRASTSTARSPRSWRSALHGVTLLGDRVAQARARRHLDPVRDRLPARLRRARDHRRLPRRDARALVLRAPPDRRQALAQPAPRDAGRLRARADPHARRRDRRRLDVAARAHALTADPGRGAAGRAADAASAGAVRSPARGGRGSERRDRPDRGGGLAAQRCAESLRAHGHDGPSDGLAAEPHAPYDRPPLSKASSPASGGARPAPRRVVRRARLELRTGTTATGLDPERGVRLEQPGERARVTTAC